ncbi:hypothetical protein [Enhygromyxa salina]|uniref:hypothetical protein n=1 Tax=Enhygromyxa salina TaxID=215803 RepID=UPI000697ACC4|nr:hypothetical protein [Enhygromyxa salina]
MFTLGLEFSSGYNLALRIDQGLATTKAQARVMAAAREAGSHHAEAAAVATLIQLVAEHEEKGTFKVSGSSYYDVYHQVDNRTLIIDIYENSTHP